MDSELRLCGHTRLSCVTECSVDAEGSVITECSVDTEGVTECSVEAKGSVDTEGIADTEVSVDIVDTEGSDV